MNALAIVLVGDQRWLCSHDLLVMSERINICGESHSTHRTVMAKVEFIESRILKPTTGGLE